MNLEELFIIREKISYNDTLLQTKDLCAAESKYMYRYKLEYLISQLIKHEKNVALLENLILKYENKIEYTNYNLTRLLFSRCLSLNKTNAPLFKKFSEYLLLNFHSHQESVETAKQINYLVDQQKFDKALELVLKNI
jgi:hypothetical protein